MLANISLGFCFWDIIAAAVLLITLVMYVLQSIKHRDSSNKNN